MKSWEDKFIVFKSLTKHWYSMPHLESIYFDTSYNAKNRVILWLADPMKTAGRFTKQDATQLTT